MSTEEQKQFVLDVMNDYYLYYDQVPSIDLRNYESPEAVLDALLVEPDRFSYIGNRIAQQNFFEEGTYEGIGYGRIIDATDNTETVIYVFDDSAAGRSCPESNTSSCLQRGDIILSSSRSGNDINFNVDRSGSLFNVTLTIGIVGINSVLTTDIQTRSGITVGYLALSNFLAPTVAELDTAFADFNQNNIDELILDLRYNAGGFVDTAQVLASYIAGINGVGSDVTRLEWNDLQTQRNERIPFLSLENQLDLNRLYVLTLSGTCSASELVMNAITGIAGIELVTIGQATCGKPVGSISFSFGDNKILQPITFSVVNDAGNGDYFNGIEATCFAEDDTARAFSDPTERMYAGALHHIENGSCEFIATRSPSKKIPSSTFNPDPMANVF
ncbi:MAG: C-terminal processing protease CtpA/Prc [Cellvibrionaceae bacterium]|jgi:C-terminal processing protease CtpA/Prc